MKAQGNNGFFAGGGMMYYNGDLSDKSNKVFTKTVFFHPYVTAGISHWFAGHLETSLSFTHGNVDGADSLSSEKDNLKRNLSFRSSIDELSFHIELNSLHRYERNPVNLFVFSGISVFKFNPQALLDGTWYDLQPLGTEGQYIATGNYPKPYKRIAAAVPVGAGIAFQLTKLLRLKVEFTHRLLFTDYLDDVSSHYPDLETLLSTPNGELAAALSSRQKDGKFPAQTRTRGHSDQNDTYSSFGVSLVYNPGVSRCPATFKSTKIKRKKY